MKIQKNFDVIIIGGSYSGLAASMALGRASRQVLLIDNGKPCNEQTPYSHNFLTQDGKTPLEILTTANQQLENYKSVEVIKGLATYGIKLGNNFSIQILTGEIFNAKKIIIASGIIDLMSNISGYADCWGISVLHCPYCHGYEIRNEKTGILGNGVYGFEFAQLISNWTKDLTLFTNGKSTLTREETERLEKNHINVVETEIDRLENTNGYLENIVFKGGLITPIKALYARSPFEQQCQIPQSLGCEILEEGYIKIDVFHKTTINGVFACGDNSSRIRTIANAVAAGTTTGMMVNKEIILEAF